MKNKTVKTKAGNKVRMNLNKITPNVFDLFLIVDTGAEEEICEEYIGSVVSEIPLEEIETDYNGVLTEKLSALEEDIDKRAKVVISRKILKKCEGCKVSTLEELKRILNLACGDISSFYIQLKVGRSWKDIAYSDKVDNNGNQKFFINNEIDESEQVLSEEELFNKDFTNIGEAITSGNFYYAWT